MTAERRIVVEALRPEQAGPAYALVRTAMPQLSLAQWVHFVEQLGGGGDPAGQPAGERGILLARDREGLLLGLVAYRLAHDLCHGPVLLGENLIAFGLLDHRPTAEGLVRALEEIAARLGCDRLQLSLPQPAPPPGTVARPAAASGLAALLQGRGHRLEGLVLGKGLGPAGP